MNICTCICEAVYTCANMWKPKDSIRFSPLSFSTNSFEAQSSPAPEAHFLSVRLETGKPQ